MGPESQLYVISDLRPLSRSSLVVGPHPDNLDGALGTIDLINQTMLNVDAAGIRAGKISDEFLVWRRTLKRIFRDDAKKPLCLRPKICRSDFPHPSALAWCKPTNSPAGLLPRFLERLGHPLANGIAHPRNRH